MRSTVRWLPIAGTGLLSTAAATAAAALVWQRGYPMAAIAALFAVLTAAITWSLVHAQRRQGVPLTLGAVADRLAQLLDTQVDGTGLLPVGLRAEPPGPGTDQPPTAEPDGTVADIDALFARLTTKRLVLLGPPGSGKTFAAARLAQRLLSARTPGDPVPVLLDLGSWDPSIQALPDWIAIQLTADHAGFAGRDAGDALSTARALIDEGFIMPILDGLDSLDAALRPKAVSRIASALPAPVPLVLTCRTEEYTAIGDRGPAPSAAATVRYLHPLEIATVTEHLRSTAGNAQSQRRWRPVFERMATDPGGPISASLCTPLTLALARTRYNPPAGTPFDAALPNPDELCEAQRFPDATTIERLLLDAFIPAAYRSAGKRDDRRIARANGTLVALARELNRRGSRDIAWWELRLAVDNPRKFDRWFVGVVTTLAVLPFERWQIAVFVGAFTCVAFVVSSGAIPDALLDGKPRRIVPRPPNRASFGRNVRLALSSGLVVGIGVGVFTDWRTGLVAGAAMGFANWWVGPIRAVFGFDDTADIRTLPPRRAVAQDRWLTLLQTSESTVTGTLAGYAMQVLPGNGLPLGISIGAISLLRGAWGRWVLARLWWRVHHAAPLRMLAFLEQAERNQVLVRVGPVYRFRHAAVQDRLAGGSRPGTRDASAAVVPPRATPAGQPVTSNVPVPPQADPDTPGAAGTAASRPIVQLHGGITKLATTPDSRFLVTAGTTPAALVWDLRDRTAPVVVAVTHSRWDATPPDIRSFAIQGDGTVLATGAMDGVIGLFTFDSPADPQPITRVRAHRDDVAGLDFHPSSPLLAAAGGDHTATLWDVSDPSSPRLTATLHEHNRPVRSVRFSPDGAWLVTGGRDGVACLWDVRRPTDPVPCHRFPGGVGWIFATAFHPGGGLLAVAGRSGHHTLWSVPRTGPPVRQARIARYGYTAAFSTDGALLATGHPKGAGLWNHADPSHPELIAHIPSTFAVTAVAFHRTDAVIGGGLDGSLAVWKLDDLIPAVSDAASSDTHPA
ncbi:hypothetical protein [Streptomyces sp. NPDC005209]|uniref:NACHT and WD40 repeat domain-containing protein n=1 Tax=Streptomyces sp. NPDC005209 TaxID=3156715 RepID=UPI0033A8891E